MVSLTKNQTVDPLHGRFRAAQQEPAQNFGESAEGSNEVSNSEEEDATLDTRVGEVVRYVPPTPRETRSQQDRLAKANTGDLRARLDLITAESAEVALGKRRCEHQPERSILSYLQDPGDGLARYQAACSILEQLADQTETAGFDSALVFRYIEAHELWKDHPSPDIRSAEDLVSRLGNSDFVQANIVLGTSAQSTKRNCARVIATSWGDDWFDKIPTTMKNPTWRRAEECSKRTLAQIAGNVKRGISLEKAVESWTEAIKKRNNPAARRECQPRSRVTQYLMPDDVATVNRVTEEQGGDGQTSDTLYPSGAGEDMLRVEVAVLSSAPKVSPSRPNYSIGSRPRKTRKRRRAQVEEGRVECEDELQREGSWVKIGERSMVKRVRNHRIRKPVEDTEDSNGESDYLGSSTDQPRDDRVTPPSAQSSKTQAVGSLSTCQKGSRPRPTCDGPAVALMFRKFIEFCDEIPSLDNDEASERKCCDACRALIAQRSAFLRSEFEKWATELEAVQSHTSHGDKILPSQEHDISPLRQAPLRQSPVTAHDSDSAGSDK
jgi:hypothetical protein